MTLTAAAIGQQADLVFPIAGGAAYFNKIYQSQNQADRVGRSRHFNLGPVFKVLRGPQHQHGFDPLSVEVLEVSDVAGYQIVGLALNRGQQNWLILRLESDVPGTLRPCGASTVDTDSTS